MSLTRRTLLKGTAVALAGGTPAILPAFGQDLRRIRMGFGVKSISPIVINVLIGEGLGYYREEGLTFQAMPLGANASVQIAVDKGDTEFGVGTPSFQLPLYARNELPPIVNFYEYTYPYKWDISVKPDSSIKSYGELKGKKIGVSDMGTTDYPVTRAVLQNLDIDPDKDVTWIAVGAGVSAGVALQRGIIDALAYFDTGFGQIEGAGIEMRFLPRPQTVPLIGGLFISARADFIKTNRKLCVGIARATAKASEFLLANPTAGAKVFLDLYPETAPRGSSQADAIKAILFSINRRVPLYRPPYPDTKMGYIREDELKLDGKFLGLDIKDVKPLINNDMIDEINDFDRDKIIAQAKGFKI
jgi:NitT/TauT family transport system substrate-binding protein